MPSIAADPSRHSVIDARPGQYICFPDVRLTRNGRLLCVYRQADQHVATRSDLLYATSKDLGRTWSAPRYLNAGSGHCPRITLLEDGRILVIDDHSRSIYWSLDNARTFTRQSCTGDYIPIPDRVLAVNPTHFLTTGHTHRGEQPQPLIRQAPSEQMVYGSGNQGGAWHAYSVLAYDPCLVLCEASMTALPGGRLLALLRENSFVYEPMYFCLSEDLGVSWSRPRPTPVCGHRPCVGMTPSGKVLVTYRNVGPDGGTAAWMGSLEELDQDHKPHGLHPSLDNPVLTGNGLLIANAPGPEACVRYALRPMTDPRSAHAGLQAEVLVEEAQEKACAIHFCGWWRLFPDRVEPPAKDAPALPVQPGQPLRIGLRYSPGRVTATVNGHPAGEYPADPNEAMSRAVLFGNASTREANGGRHFWRSLSLGIQEPRYERDFSWNWDHTQGFPDAYVTARVLELDNDRLASSGDYGYSGWELLPDGGYFCAYHHGGGDAPGYEPGRSSHVRGAWFYDSDFS